MTDDVVLKLMFKKLVTCLESELAEDFLTILLGAMKAVCLLDGEYRRNIEGFCGRYQFRSADDQVQVAVIFDGGTMKVMDDEAIADPHITITFRDGRALMRFLLSPKPDILGGMLRQEVSPSGNLNYLLKFGYMARRLQLIATGQR